MSEWMTPEQALAIAEPNEEWLGWTDEGYEPGFCGWLVLERDVFGGRFITTGGEPFEPKKMRRLDPVADAPPAGTA